MPIFLLLWKKNIQVYQLNRSIKTQSLLKNVCQNGLEAPLTFRILKNVFRYFRLNVYHYLVMYVGKLMQVHVLSMNYKPRVICIPIEVVMNKLRISIKYDYLRIRKKNSLFKNATHLFAFFNFSALITFYNCGKNAIN